MMSLPVWLPGPMFFLGRISVSGPMFLLGRGVSVQGVCAGGLCPRKLCLGDVSVQAGVCPGGLGPGGSLSRWVSVQGGLCRETPPPESEMWVVCILLECFLVIN